MGLGVNVVQRNPLSGQKPEGKVLIPTSDELYYYHRTFGKSARKCSQPCAGSAGHSKGLFCLCDDNSGQQFLVDTGAEISILPATRVETARSFIVWQPMALQ